jgi:hypothetical protein
VGQAGRDTIKDKTVNCKDKDKTKQNNIKQEGENKIRQTEWPK